MWWNELLDVSETRRSDGQQLSAIDEDADDEDDDVPGNSLLTDNKTTVWLS